MHTNLFGKKKYENKMQVRKEGTMTYVPKGHLWPLLRGHQKYKVQMTFLVSVI